MLRVIVMVAFNILATLAFAYAQNVYFYPTPPRGDTSITMYSDARGRLVGDSMRTGNITIYSDAHGRMVGDSIDVTPLPPVEHTDE